MLFSLDTLLHKYAFTGWCTGPDSIAGLLWAPALFNLSRADQTCGVLPGTSISSGVDGQKCAGYFNESLFLEHGGAACISPTLGFPDAPSYVYDASLVGCQAAYDSFRNDSLHEEPFTCWCQDDHATLGGGADGAGIRSGTVFVYTNLVAIVLIALTSPFLGARLDRTGGKRWWYALVVTTGVGMLGMGVLGPGYLWLVATFFQVLTIIASELVLIPRQSYLHDLHDVADAEGYKASAPPRMACDPSRAAPRAPPSSCPAPCPARRRPPPGSHVPRGRDACRRRRSAGRRRCAPSSRTDRSSPSSSS